MLHKVLEDYGLTATEANVYLASLAIGYAPASSIARSIGENRMTVYATIKNLQKKGLAMQTSKNKVTYFSVIKPEKLIEKLQQKEQMLQSLLPEFHALSIGGEFRPKVEFYEGLEGLKKIFEETLNEKGPLRAFIGTNDIHPDFQQYIDTSYVPQRIKKKLQIQIIAPNNPKDKKLQNNEKKFLRETILIEPKLFQFASEIILYGESKVGIAMYSKTDMAGIIIDSKNLHDSLVSIFNLVWLSHKKK